ncbi:MAG TPA: cyanophycin synthetase [Actinomycetota bacterium]|nr:cyanophycin synthetase [Actinomycetota bacterium]
MRFAQALDELDGRQPEDMPEPDLERIGALAELLDHPERTYPTIHVTGTNGKTTTARLISRLACAHGLTTGLFTSPHLDSVVERFEVCGRAMGEGEFGEEYEHLLPYLQTVDRRVGRVTYFEALTALAYLWFADKPVDLGVYEVGMGGTWDATNLVAGDVAVLCPMALDHPELGSTVGEVAEEKAGIIKPGKGAIVREQPPDALAVVEARCREVGAAMLLEDRDWALEGRALAVGGQTVSIRGLHAVYEGFLLPLFGAAAAHSAAAAIAATETLLGRPLSEEATRATLEGATSPGRLEVVARHPLVVLDGAHNPAAAEALAAALREAFVWDRLHLVVAVFANKDLDGIARHLAGSADVAYAATGRSRRSRPAAEIAAAFSSQGIATRTFDSITGALSAAREAAGERDLILVTGSLYTVADARRELLGMRGRPGGGPAQEGSGT